MFELMKISETINEGVVDPYYLKKLIRDMVTVMVTSVKLGEESPHQKATQKLSADLGREIKGT